MIVGRNRNFTAVSDVSRVMCVPLRTGVNIRQGMIMNQQRRNHLEARARVLKAMAHPSRLLIIEELEQSERCVCDLTEMVGADVSTVSKHLAVLRQAGIVLDEKRGNQVFYRLRVPCILNFFGCVESVLEASAREQAAYLQAVAR